MAITHGPRLGLTRWSDDADEFTRDQLDADHALLEELAAIADQGLEGALPAAGVAGRFHLSTDTGRLRFDNGVGWREVIVGGLYVGGDSTDPEQVAVGNTARADVITEAATWTGRLAVSADDWDAPALYLHGNDAAADTSALLRAVTEVALLGHQERARIDNDGGTRIGRNTSSLDPTVPRSAFLTVRPHDPAERGIVIDANGPGGLTADLIVGRTQGTRRFTVDAKGRIYLSSLSDNDVPATPGGAGVIYCNAAGDLYYKSPSGNVRLLATH